MGLLESVGVALFIIVVVFTVLVILWGLISLFTVALRGIESKWLHSKKNN